MATPPHPQPCVCGHLVPANLNPEGKRRYCRAIRELQGISPSLNLSKRTVVSNYFREAINERIALAVILPLQGALRRTRLLLQQYGVPAGRYAEFLITELITTVKKRIETQAKYSTYKGYFPMKIRVDDIHTATDNIQRQLREEDEFIDGWAKILAESERYSFPTTARFPSFYETYMQSERALKQQQDRRARDEQANKAREARDHALEKDLPLPAAPAEDKRKHNPGRPAIKKVPLHEYNDLVKAGQDLDTKQAQVADLEQMLETLREQYRTLEASDSKLLQENSMLRFGLQTVKTSYRPDTRGEDDIGLPSINLEDEVEPAAETQSVTSAERRPSAYGSGARTPPDNEVAPADEQSVVSLLGFMDLVQRGEEGETMEKRVYWDADQRPFAA